MIKINVIDLDNTVLPYDSFRKLAKSELKRINLYIWSIATLRVLKIISSYKFKLLLIKYWSNTYDKLFFENYAKLIFKDLDKKILSIISLRTDVNTINILISASPDLYVNKLIYLLGWEGKGSYFKNEKFINLYSIEKLNWLSSNYPSSKFQYNFAISDSHSDDKLLSLFDESVLHVSK